MLLRLTSDLENGKRGYLLTGDESFLAPYKNALRDLDGDARGGAGHGRDGTRGRAGRAEFANDVHAWIGEIERAADQGEGGGDAGQPREDGRREGPHGRDARHLLRAPQRRARRRHGAEGERVPVRRRVAQGDDARCSSSRSSSRSGAVSGSHVTWRAPPESSRPRWRRPVAWSPCRTCRSGATSSARWAGASGGWRRSSSRRTRASGAPSPSGSARSRS